MLTSRAISWAINALAHDDTTVSALARHLKVDWHTLWNAVRGEATRRTERPERTRGVRTLGVDEHIWRPSHHGRDRAVTAMVDLTRDEHGRLHARLIDVVPGRSGVRLRRTGSRPSCPSSSPGSSTLRSTRSAVTPTRSATSFPMPSRCSTPSTSCGWARQVVDEVRRRVQQETLRRRGHRDDPLYKVRGLLRHGAENLTPAPAGQARDRAAPWRPARRGRPRLAVLPAASIGLPGQAAGRGSTHRHKNHPHLAHLPDPRSGSTRPDPAAVATTSAGLLRHQAASPTAAPKRSTC